MNDRNLTGKTEILYLGWLMAGTVKGYQKARKRFSVEAVCGVGMSGGNSQIADIRKTNRISDSLPVFYLQGGSEPDKLHGIYRLMMKTMKAAVGKGLAGKENRTPEENDMLDLMLNGGDRVCEANLSAVIDWLRKE